MFSHYVRAILHHANTQTNSSAHALDLIEGNIVQDFNESVLVGRPLIAQNRTLFESSRTYLHFLEQVSRGIRFVKPVLYPSQEEEEAIVARRNATCQTERVYPEEEESLSSSSTNNGSSIQTNDDNPHRTDGSTQTDDESLLIPEVPVVVDVRKMRQDFDLELQTAKHTYELQISTLKTQVATLDMELDSVRRTMGYEREAYLAQIQQKQLTIESHLLGEERNLNAMHRAMLSSMSDHFKQLQQSRLMLEAEWENKIAHLQYEQFVQEQQQREVTAFMQNLRAFFTRMSSVWNQVLQNPEYFERFMRCLCELEIEKGVQQQQSVHASEEEEEEEEMDTANQLMLTSTPSPAAQTATYKRYAFTPLRIEEEDLPIGPGENVSVGPQYYRVSESSTEDNTTMQQHLQEENESLRRRVIEQTKSIADLERLHTDEVDRLNDKLSKLSEECNARIAQINSDAADSRRSEILKDRESIIEQQHARLVELQSELKTAQQTGEARTREIQTLRNSVEGEIERYRELKKTCDEILAQKRELSDKHNALLTAHNFCELKLDNLKNSLNVREGLDFKDRQNEEMKREIKNLEQRNAQLEGDMRTLTSKHDKDVYERKVSYDQLASKIQDIYSELFSKNRNTRTDEGALQQIGSTVLHWRTRQVMALNLINPALSEPKQDLYDAVESYARNVTDIFRRFKTEIGAYVPFRVDDPLHQISEKVLGFVRKVTRYYLEIFKKLNSSLQLTDVSAPVLSIDDIDALLDKAAILITNMKKRKCLDELDRESATMSSKRRGGGSKDERTTSLMLDLVWSFNRTIIYKYFELLYNYIIDKNVPVDVKHFVAEIQTLQEQLTQSQEFQSSIYRTFILNHLRLVHSVIDESESYDPISIDDDDESGNLESVYRAFRALEEKITSHITTLHRSMDQTVAE